MRRVILLVAATSATAYGGEPPELLRKLEFNCATLSAAVNHYQALGEEAAVKELEGLARDPLTDFGGKFGRNERVGWICRVLFEPTGKEPLRGPRFGAHLLPHHSMPAERWPLYPVAAAGKSYFVLSEGYMLGGVPEPLDDYLAYCRTRGRFRAGPVPVPTRDQALKDADSLHGSDAWKAIRWEDSGPGFSYRFNERWVWGFIQTQADRTPGK